ncbi:MAG: hypothetical protein NW204_03020 [Xanthomonadaceae bacterium]|nr:hypothetical protein [Xanthomonadaceae bacterium]
MDAKQRAILRNAALSEDGKKKGVTRVCSEPSPDVFSVVAQALGASGSFGKSVDPARMEAALSAAFSSAEQGSTIPRTQTINMLRELMFRTCERYLNGAYNELEISIQAIRDQRLIVSILAIEQITGVVTPAPVIIGAAGTSSGGGGNAAIVRLDDALKAKEAAEIAYRNAETHFNELNGEQKVCDSIADAVKKGEDLSEPQNANQAKCDQARTSMASAREFLTTNTDHHANLRRLSATGDVTASTQVTSSVLDAADGGRTDAIEKVADIVNAIVLRSFSDDTEVMLFCLKSMTDRDLSTRMTDARYQSLLTSCLDYLNERVRVEEQKLKEEAQQSVARMRLTDATLFDQFWPGLEQRINTQEKKQAFIAKLGSKLLTPESSKAECFRNADTKDEYRKCFLELPADLKRNLPGVE